MSDPLTGLSKFGYSRQARNLAARSASWPRLGQQLAAALRQSQRQLRR
jgi:hypothetical protein